MGCLGVSRGCLGDVLGLINRESAQFTWCSSTNESNDTLALVQLHLGHLIRPFSPIPTQFIHCTIITTMSVGVYPHQ